MSLLTGQNIYRKSRKTKKMVTNIHITPIFILALPKISAMSRVQNTLHKNPEIHQNSMSTIKLWDLK